MPFGSNCEVRVKLKQALASLLAAETALVVASEMLERERSLLVFSVWAAWEMVQVRESLLLTPPLGEGE